MKSNIHIKNIYYMLCYAFQILKTSEYRNIGTEEFENTGDLFAEILYKGIEQQIKRYLNREYVTMTESLSCLRGKIEINSSIKQMTLLNKKLVCSFDEFSINSYMNRVLKSCMLLLIKSDIQLDKKRQLKSLLCYFTNVNVLNVNKINWYFKFNHNNKTYQMLMEICYLLVKGLLQTTTDGNTKLMHFLDDQRMCRLYEKFILEYYRKEHKELNVSSSQINWMLDDDKYEYLPKMQSDVMISYKGKILIIDAKFYSRSMQESFGAKTVHSNNLYQIFTYVKNKQFEVSEPVAGMLLYAKTDEDIVPDFEYKMSGNRILVKTLDLNCRFEEIRSQLDGIVERVFQEEEL